MTAPFERNHTGAPLIAHPTRLVKSGERAGLPFMETYGRPSSMGKQIENTYNLTKWGERMAFLGIALAPELAARLKVLAEATPEQREEYEWKRACDSLVADAKKAAKADLAADQGTHGHTITEDDDDERDWVQRAEAGEALGIPVEAQRAMVEAWRKMLAETGLEILGIEVPVVHDEWRQAGSLDRWGKGNVRIDLGGGEFVDLGDCQCPACTSHDGPWHGVLDVKTGRMRTSADGERIQYWQSYAVQIAAYATANAIYDSATHTRRPIPWPICQKWALIAHLPVTAALEGSARCELVLVDIEAGAKAAELCVAAKVWDSSTAVAQSTFKRGPAFVVPATIPQPASPPTSPGEGAPASRGLIAAALAASASASATSTAGVSCTPDGAPPVADDVRGYRVVGLTFVPSYPGNVHRIGAHMAEASRSERVAVRVVRNPDNKHDANAIEVHVPWLGEEDLVGHLDRDTAAKLAPVMDAGQVFDAWVDAVLVAPENPTNPGIRVCLKPDNEATFMAAQSELSLLERRNAARAIVADHALDPAPTAAELTAASAASVADAFDGLTNEPKPEPRRTFPTTPREAPRRAVAPDEGPAAATVLVEQFQATWGALDAASQSWIKALAEQGHAAGRSFSVAQRPSIRRVAIARALVSMAKAGCDTDEVLVALLAVALGEEPQASIPLGAVLGSLTIDQAHRLAELAVALGAKTLEVLVADDGRYSLTGPALAGCGRTSTPQAKADPDDW